MSDLPPDPFAEDPPGIEDFPEELQAFARELLVKAPLDVRALWAQRSMQDAYNAVTTFDEPRAKAVALAMLIDIKRQVMPRADFERWFLGD